MLIEVPLFIFGALRHIASSFFSGGHFTSPPCLSPTRSVLEFPEYKKSKIKILKIWLLPRVLEFLTTKRADFFQKLIDKVSRRIITQRILFIRQYAVKLLKTISMTQSKIQYAREIFYSGSTYEFIHHSHQKICYLPTYGYILKIKISFSPIHTLHGSLSHRPGAKKPTT